jgi:hypothetical protein
MSTIIVISILLGYCMLVWFKTNAFVEYMNLFNASRFFHLLTEYNNVHKDGYDGNLSEFLREYYHDKFLVRLTTCPICLSFWLGAISAMYIDSFGGLLCAPLILFSYLLFNRML